MTRLKKTNRIKPICIGSGLVALDVILNGNPATPAKLCVGGSCGNILSILSFLGWNSKPIARLSNHIATTSLLKDFNNFNVSPELISTSKDGSTPIIIHRILRDKLGNAKHRFEFRIPGKNIWLPGYKPILSSAVNSIIIRQAVAQVFYFDRVSRSTINLAKYYKSKGALIIFEPSSYKGDKQFSECLALTDIIKFSSERIKNYSDLFPSPIVPLEIVTLGNGGLNYRLKAENKSDWNRLLPFKIENLLDSAGAGDWCTAGIINELGQNGKESFNSATKKDIINSLIIGQALGALNCYFDGARGIMYNMNYLTLNKLITKIVSGNNINTNFSTSKVEIQSIGDFNFEVLLKETEF